MFYFLIEKGATAKGAYARWKASESSDAFWKGFVVLYIKVYILEIVVYFSTTVFFKKYFRIFLERDSLSVWFYDWQWVLVCNLNLLVLS